MVEKKTLDNISKNKLTHGQRTCSLRINVTFSCEVVLESMTRKLGLQSGVRLCIMPGLPKHLVQELNVGTVAATASKSTSTAEY